MKPRIFIGSSSHGKNIAAAIHNNLRDFGEITEWSQGVFKLTASYLDSLEQALSKFDYAIFVYTPDDVASIKNSEYIIPRDNVIFETGLFIGKLGSKKVFFVSPKSIENFHLLSDLSGIHHGQYDSNRTDHNWVAALAPFCNDVIQHITQNIQEEIANQFCQYLVRYANKEEPLIYSKKSMNISYERAYNLLLYMFNHERFEEFMAFDLAFDRWEELIQFEHSQTVNISLEIFEAMNSILEQNRCQLFRRILVIDQGKLGSNKTFEVLKFFYDKERQWNYLLGRVAVETKIYVYSTIGNPGSVNKIRELNDFALFKNQHDSFSIIETTLTAPNDFVSNPMCQVNCDIDKINSQTDGFNRFWALSKDIKDIFSQFYSRNEMERNRLPKEMAFNYFHKHMINIDRAGIVIEGGYFDLRAPDDEERYYHLEDALWLYENLVNFVSDKKSILLESFINDFSTSSICQFKYCDVDLVNSSKEDKDRLIIELLESIRSKYRVRNISATELEIFGMRNTRNKVSKYLKELIKENKKIELINNEEQLFDVSIKSDKGDPILLGYYDLERSAVTVRCTSIMAQHYYDLFNFIKIRKPDINELWIFDFNKIEEKKSVNLGARASLDLFDWPKDLKLNIVNCIYNPDDRTGTIDVVGNNQL
ncbi:nucleotide-binding protein [Haliscomenobacter sp.]|uniref:nucleotide-binding protein n=1 Tax=Haliscomenobacter sp. TaxID=2717303 RepID=UPI003BABCA6D